MLVCLLRKIFVSFYFFVVQFIQYRVPSTLFNGVYACLCHIFCSLRLHVGFLSTFTIFRVFRQRMAAKQGYKITDQKKKIR